MPNGGSDCCGTCWFNRANEGQPGFPKKTERPPAYCEIRDVAIANPFWTYCANHPHHNPDRVEVPVGPIFVCDDYPYTRRPLVECPDTETVRVRLLELLRDMPETPRREYPTETKFDHQVIAQLMAFREVRAVDELRRVVRFNPLAASEPGDGPFVVTRAVTVGQALEALAVLVGEGALEELRNGLRCGLEAARAQPEYQPRADKLAPVRYHAVRGLAHCPSREATALLQAALQDPHPEIVAFAKEFLDRRSDPEPTSM